MRAMQLTRIKSHFASLRRSHTACACLNHNVHMWVLQATLPAICSSCVNDQNLVLQAFRIAAKT